MEEDLFTAEEVAAEVGVSKSAIYVWTNRGALSPSGKRGRYNLYRMSDVFAAEKSRARKYRRNDAE